MDESRDGERRRWRFSMRDLLAWMLVIALALGWWRSTVRARMEVARIKKQAEFAKRAEKDRTWREETTASVQSRGPNHYKNRSPLSGGDFTGLSLRGVSVDGGSSGMQGSVFDDCDM